MMRSGIARALVIAAAGLCLAACSADKFVNPFDSKTPESKADAAQTPGADAFAAAPASDSAVAAPDADAPAPLATPIATDTGLLGSDPYDTLSLGKKQYRAGNFGLAEKYFRHAAELRPRDAEAWLGLAASYDRLRRFDLADRAYAQAIGILGRTAEVLNNQGYSYMLRGDYKRAHEILVAAQRKDPRNRYVQNNLQLLELSSRTGKAIE